MVSAERQPYTLLLWYHCETRILGAFFDLMQLEKEVTALHEQQQEASAKLQLADAGLDAARNKFEAACKMLAELNMPSSSAAQTSMNEVSVHCRTAFWLHLVWSFLVHVLNCNCACWCRAWLHSRSTLLSSRSIWHRLIPPKLPPQTW